MSISVGRSPVSSSPAGEADSSTIAELGRNSAMPLAISSDPNQFDYDELFGGMPGDNSEETTWLTDYNEGLRLARETSRPFIVWFSNPQYSPADRQMSADVFGHEDFLAAARNRTVRVKLDYSNNARARSDFYVRLKKHFGARGYPFVAIVLPDGTTVNEFRGYRPQFRRGYLDNFKLSIDEAVETIEKRQRDLAENEGYRWWEGGNGRRLFAHPVQYDDGTSRLALAGMWGQQWIVSAINLSERDRSYLARWLSEDGAEQIHRKE